jgi:hypothetical protein
MLALSIRQPYAELILRGIKTVEYRTRPTRIIGERFYIYASKGQVLRGKGQVKAWSDDLQVGQPSAWMIELAKQVGMIEADAELPTGVIVGSAVIDKVSRLESFGGDDGMWQWHLADVKRMKTPRKPRGRPQPVWWRPF